MDLFKLLGTISIENSEANDAIRQTSGEAEKTESKMSKAFSAIGKGAVAVGKTIGVGLAAGATAMGGLTVKAMNLAGELEQNMGGSEQVFKEYAGKMQETARSAFENMGLSTSDFLGTANKMGALFQGAGFSIEESSNLASDAMQRAADVASIMGIDTASAMEAIAGAAKGNFTMMDNLGVAMNDTTLNAYALEKGIGKTTQQMTNQEKIGLAMEMFMEKTSYAAGNYARENETLAGSLGTAKAALTNFLDGSGDVESLVTAFSNAADVIVKNIGEIAPRLITGLQDIINQVLPLLPPLLDQLLPVIVEGAVGLVNGLVQALPAIIDAIMTALPALIQGVQQIIEALILALPMILQSLVSALPTLIPMLINGLVSMFVMLCQQFGQIIQPIINNLPAIIVSIVNALTENLPLIIEGLIALVMALVEAAPQIMKACYEATPMVIQALIDSIIACLPMLIDGLTQLLGGVADAAVTMWDTVKTAFVEVFQSIWDAMTKVFEVVGTWFTDQFTKAKEGVQKAWSNVKQFFSGVWSGISGAFSSVGSFFTTAFSNAWESIKSIFSGVGSFFSGIWDTISSTFSDLGTKIGDAMSGAVKAGINGILSTIENVINGFFKLINGAIDLINAIPGVNISKIKLVKFTRLAEGGVVDKPTPAIFGEDGAEAVVPLENNTGWLNKVALKLSEFMSYKDDIGNSLSIRSVELAERQVSELQILNITTSKILAAVLAMDENMGGNLREALDGMSFGVNNREFARLVKESI